MMHVLSLSYHVDSSWHKKKIYHHRIQTMIRTIPTIHYFLINYYSFIYLFPLCSLIIIYLFIHYRNHEKMSGNTNSALWWLGVREPRFNRVNKLDNVGFNTNVGIRSCPFECLHSFRIRDNIELYNAMARINKTHYKSHKASQCLYVLDLPNFDQIQNLRAHRGL